VVFKSFYFPFLNLISPFFASASSSSPGLKLDFLKKVGGFEEEY